MARELEAAGPLPRAEVARMGTFVASIAWLSAVGLAALLAAAFAPTFFGYQSLIVVSGSMGRAMPIGSVALTKTVEPNVLGPGDVISFRYPARPQTTTHRIVSVVRKGNSYVFRTKGDANPAPDPEPLAVDGPVPRVEHVVPYAGTIVRIVRTPGGAAAVFLIPILGLTFDRRRDEGHAPLKARTECPGQLRLFSPSKPRKVRPGRTPGSPTVRRRFAQPAGG